MWNAIGAIGSSLLGGVFGSIGASNANKASAKAAKAKWTSKKGCPTLRISARSLTSRPPASTLYSPPN